MTNIYKNSNRLVTINYYRKNNKSEVKSAVVTEKQACDIRILLPHIHIINVIPAPSDSMRSYILY